MNSKLALSRMRFLCLMKLSYSKRWIFLSNDYSTRWAVGNWAHTSLSTISYALSKDPTFLLLLLERGPPRSRQGAREVLAELVHLHLEGLGLGGAATRPRGPGVVRV